MDATRHAQANQLFLRYRQDEDLEALTQLFDTVSQELLALSNHLAPDAAQAEDLLQETFLTAIETSGKWNSQRAVLPWLVGIMVNKARAARRRGRRYVDPSRLTERTSPDGLEAAQLNELRRSVRSVIDGLPEKDAKLLLDVFDRGLAPGELATEAGVAIGTMRVRMHRAIEKLRQALPAGFAGGGAILGVRGIDAVRKSVEEAAARKAQATEVAAASGGITLLGMRLSNTTLAVGGVLVATATLAMMGDPPTPSQPISPGGMETVQAATNTPEANLVPGDLAAEREPAPANEANENPNPSNEPVPHAAPAKARLILDVSGVLPALDNPAMVRVRRWREAGASMMDLPIDRNGQLEWDVSSLFQNAPIHARDQVSMYLEHPDYLDFGIEIPQVSGGRVTTFSAPLELQPIVARWTGTLACPDGFSPANRWVGFWPGSVPEDPEAMARELVGTRTDALGRFQLDLPKDGSGTLFAVVPGLAVFNQSVTSDGQSQKDLGVLTVDRGVSISGTAYLANRAVDGGVQVIATPVDARLNRLLRRNGVRAVQNQVLFARATARTDDSGMFVIEGLARGVEYRVSLADPSLNAQVFSCDPLLGEGHLLRAPARNVHLDPGLTRATLAVHAAGDILPGAHVRFTFPTDYRIDPDPNPYQDRFRRVRALDEQGRLSLAIPASGSLGLQITAPGHSSSTCQLKPAMLDEQGHFVIELTLAPPGSPESNPVVVEVKLTGSGSEALEGSEIAMDLFDIDGSILAVPNQRVLDGKVRFGPLPRGRFTFALRTLPNTKTHPAELPFVRTRFATHHRLNSQALPTDGVFRMEHEVELGGRLELHLEGFDGGPSPARFELVKFSGYTRQAQILHLDEVSGGYFVAADCAGPGPFWIGPFIEPGPWTLRQVGKAYAETAMSVPLKLGKNTVLTFQLEPR